MPLNDQECDAVRVTMATQGWQQVMRPRYLMRGHNALKMLALFPAERTGEFAKLSDDELRSVIRECEWMTNVWDNELAANAHNRRLDELDGVNPPGEPG